MLAVVFLGRSFQNDVVVDQKILLWYFIQQAQTFEAGQGAHFAHINKVSGHAAVSILTFEYPHSGAYWPFCARRWVPTG